MRTNNAKCKKKNKQTKARENNSSLAIVEAFWISEQWELNILGLWKRSENVLTFDNVLKQGKRKEFLLLVLYECPSQLNKSNKNIVIESIRKKAFFTKIHFTYFKFDNTFKV